MGRLGAHGTRLEELQIALLAWLLLTAPFTKFIEVLIAKYILVLQAMAVTGRIGMKLEVLPKVRQQSQLLTIGFINLTEDWTTRFTHVLL